MQSLYVQFVCVLFICCFVFDPGVPMWLPLFVCLRACFVSLRARIVRVSFLFGEAGAHVEFLMLLCYVFLLCYLSSGRGRVWMAAKMVCFCD